MNVIRIFHSPEEAWTALSLLQAHQIDAQILDSQTLSILPLDSVALGGYRLAVPDHQAEDALGLLDDRQPQPAAPENRQYFGDEYQQEHDRPAPKKLPIRLFIIGLALIFLFMALSGVQSRFGIDWLF